MSVMGIGGILRPPTPVEDIAVCEGLRLFLVDAPAVRDRPGSPCRSTPDDMVAAAFRALLPPSAASCVLAIGERELEEKWAAGQCARLVALRIVPAAIDIGVAGEELPSGLVVLSRHAPGPSLHAAIRALDEIVAPPLPEPARGFYRKAKALEAVALLLAEGAPSMRPDDASPLSKRERVRLAAARDRLLADLAQPPSLRDLSDLAGLNEKRLNEGFKAMFGQTAFELLRNTRLEQARRMIAEDDAPLKDIAWRVGYRHVSNFISAYRNRFGITPGRYTRHRCPNGDATMM